MAVKKHLLCALAVLGASFFLGHSDFVHAAAGAAESGMESRIIRFIKDIYPEGKSVRVKLNSLPAGLKDNAKVVNVNFVKIPDVNGDGVCSVEIRNPAGRAQAIQVPFKVFSRRELYVLKQAGQKGDLISEKDIIVRETYMKGKLAGYPASADEIIGKALKRDVSANTVITDQFLENQVVMKKGDIVTIIAESNKLIVSAKGRTIDKGRVGENIRVKNIASGKELTAKVISSNAVKVEF